MKQIFRSLFLVLFCYGTAGATVQYVTVKPSEIKDGFIFQQVDVPSSTLVRLTAAMYGPASVLPKGVVAAAAENFTRRNGVEQKKPFAILQIPAFRTGADGKYEMLREFTLEYDDNAAGTPKTTATAKLTAASPSPFANGNWYKIAIPARGVYKVDLAFLQSLGISGSVNSANIRLLGNGGAMIYEKVQNAQSLDLKENALWMNDGGDGNFGSGDFFAFYAPGPVRWDVEEGRKRFVHSNHLYADSSYYFLSVDAGPGLRISDAPNAGNATVSVSTFNDYAAHEVDLYNPGKTGKEWWGEKFGNGSEALLSRSFPFQLNGSADSLGIRLSAASRATDYGSQMQVTLNGSILDNYIFDQVNLEDDKQPVDPKTTDVRIPFNSASASFTLNYIPAQPDNIGYLNFIELNWRRQLAFAGGNFSFRDLNSIGSGAIAGYTVSGASSATQIWDVTDPTRPQRMQGSLNGSSYYFTQNAGTLHEFVALDGSSFGKPVAKGKIANQNLRGADAPQLVIVSYPDFLKDANRLADHHRQHDGLRVTVATTDEVYNEFSSGAQDIGGIRDMMRYYYLAAGNDSSRMPRYLLLFGDASYDYKNRIAANSNYVPTYESSESVYVDNAFAVDDFFGFLDEGEDISAFDSINTLDIAVGRIPINSASAAATAVDKILAYTSAASLGPWRITNTYVGDNEDGAGPHLEDAENIAADVNLSRPYFNGDKIYLDNLPFISTPGGQRCPEANKAINDRIFKGTLLINYTGHGSTTTLAHERIMTKDDFDTWKNLYKMPFMVTATCDYARYDNPAYVSNGEALVMKADGGVIAMLTTTGPVYASINELINRQFIKAQYTTNGGIPTFGEAMRSGKNETYKKRQSSFTLINFYRFTLLGDPALQPAFPKHRVRTDAITALGSTQPADTISALGAYTLSGHVEDQQGNLLSDFNGRAYVTIYDKPRIVRLYTKETNVLREYKVQDGVIFKGLTTVTNGKFNCSFVAPKDMGYEYGRGKISYYAENGIIDGAGLDSGMTIGGFSDGAGDDNDAPVVKPFIGDTLFRDGGVTGTNTLLYVQLSDRNGINVSGGGVGHDLTAVLDGDEQHPYILNDYYQTEPNTYQRGFASFPINGLSNGKHSIKVKAWDVYNNSGEGTVNFVVGEKGGFFIENLMNYPNPFRNETHFFFGHNHPNETVHVQLAIYNTSGQMVRLIEQDFTPQTSRSNELIWDGTDMHGALLPSGVYPYRMILSTANGAQGSAYQKLVIAR